ncbi:TRAP transporter small permease subunit [Orrella sp. JC864]|uniref:TRAP transporter small permease n=1 Tax=Orrella sp. JC864 TaxID=3120298 RepID=UPI00300993D9
MRSVYEWIGRIEAAVAGILLVAMVALVLLGGLARLAAHPLNWTMDFATCFFAWACFLCADIAWRRDALMSIGLLTERLSGRARQALGYCNHLILCAFLAYLVIAGTSLAWTSRNRSFQGIPEISYSWVTASLPVGGALLLLTTVVKMLDMRRAGAPAGPAAPARQA